MPDDDQDVLDYIGAHEKQGGLDRRAYYDDQRRQKLFSYGGQGFGGENTQQNAYGDLAEDWLKRQGPQINYAQRDIDRANANQVRVGQGRTIEMLQAAAEGKAPSVAEATLHAGLDANLKNAAALANSARGGANNYAAAQQAATRQAGELGAQTTQQGAILRAGEITAARGQLFAAQAQQRAQDLQAMGMSAADAQAQAALEMQQRGLGLQGQLGFERLGYDAQALGLQGRMGYAGNATNIWQHQSNLDAASQAREDANIKATAAAGMSAFSGGAGVAAQAGAAKSSGGGGVGSTGDDYVSSDERVKMNVQPVGNAAMAQPGQQRMPSASVSRAGGEQGTFNKGDDGGSSYHALLAEGPAAFGEGGSRAGLGYTPSMYNRDGAIQKSTAPVGAEDPSYGLHASLVGNLGSAGFNPEAGAVAPGQQRFGMTQGPPAPQSSSPTYPPYVPQPMAGSTQFSVPFQGFDPGQGMVSDERQKAAVQRMPSASEQMLDGLQPYAFNYKPGAGEDPGQRRFGIMAQDLEKSPMGASIVTDTPTGKMVDNKHATGVLLAASADMNDRLKALEGRKGGR